MRLLHASRGLCWPPTTSTAKGPGVIPTLMGHDKFGFAAREVGRCRWRAACSSDNNAEAMRRINRSTKEDMQKGPSMVNRNPPMEYIAGAIKVDCRADGVFGQDTTSFGCDSVLHITARVNRSRSTTSTAPADTAIFHAQAINREPKRSNSRLSTPPARSGRSEQRELEQTISARSPVRSMSVDLYEHISKRTTFRPRSTACQAASQPANPPPRTVRCFRTI